MVENHGFASPGAAPNDAPTRLESGSSNARLDSWKEIANYLGRDVRTAQRWEKQLNLPVHRVHSKAGPVYAYRFEIDSWRDRQAVEAANRIQEQDPAPPVSEAVAGQTAPAVHPQRRFSSKMAAAAALVVCLAAGRSVTPADTGAAIRSIAILPLETFAASSSTADFAAGSMTDHLISTFAEQATLRVAPRTSAERYRGTKKRLSEIAAELRTDAIVEGSVLYDGNAIRVDIRVVDGRTEAPLWSKTYTSPGPGLIAMQDDLARKIYRDLAARLESRPGPATLPLEARRH